eukprot:13683657-Heterocapsa_arctica.AAC.1
MSLDRLGQHVVIAAICEIDVTARKTYRANWPGSIEWPDIRQVTRRLLEDLRRAAPGATGFVRAGGTPCQGLSSVNAAGQGLEDERSALFWGLPWIANVCADAFAGFPMIDFTEN